MTGVCHRGGGGLHNFHMRTSAFATAKDPLERLLVNNVSQRRRQRLVIIGGRHADDTDDDVAINDEKKRGDRAYAFSYSVHSA